MDESSESEVKSEETSPELTRPLPLGVVVAGGFSPCRGKCHGVGFLGAARFIEALDGSVHGMGMATPQMSGKKQMMLRVKVMCSSSTVFAVRYALVSLLL